MPITPTAPTPIPDLDPNLLAQANEALAKDGITLTQALNQILNYIAIEGRMPPLNCIEPNQETRTAIAEAERGDLITVGNIDDLMADLNEDD